MPLPGDGSPGPVPSAPAALLRSPGEGSHAHPLASRPLTTLQSLGASLYRASARVGRSVVTAATAAGPLGV